MCGTTLHVGISGGNGGVPTEKLPLLQFSSTAQLPEEGKGSDHRLTFQSFSPAFQIGPESWISLQSWKVAAQFCEPL